MKGISYKPMTWVTTGTCINTFRNTKVIIYYFQSTRTCINRFSNT